MTLDTSADCNGDDNGKDDKYYTGEEHELSRYLQISATLAHAFATAAIAVAAATAAAAAATAPLVPPPPPKLPPPTAFSPPPILDLDSFYSLLTFLKSTSWGLA
jgi:hypothetical protein